MTQLASDDSITPATYPPDRAIAFALAVVKSKPAELAINQYIDLLCRHIAPTHRHLIVSPTRCHLDQSSFWRSEYDRTCAVLAKTQSELIEVRRQLEALKNNSDASRPSTASRKRKQNNHIIPSLRSPRKLNRYLISEDPAVTTVSESPIMTLGDGEEAGKTLLGSLFNMHSLLRNRKACPPEDLAYYLSRATTSLASIVERSIKTAGTVTDDEQKDLKATLTTAVRAAASIFTAYNSLSRLAGHERVMGQSVYALAKMFQTFLTSLSDLSVLETRKDDTAHTTTPGKSSGRSKAAKSNNGKSNAALDHVTGFIVGIIDMFDHSVESTKELFESLVFCLLDELGTALYVSTFGKQRAKSIEAEISERFAAEDSVPDLATVRTLQQKHVDLVAPYLTYLLARTMSLTPHYLGTRSESRRPKMKPTNMKTSVKGLLTTTAKESLQRTLVKCMFGNGDVDKDYLFGHSLNFPPSTFKPVPIPKIKSADIGEWFQGEVWRILGWEILSGAQI